MARSPRAANETSAVDATIAIALFAGLPVWQAVPYPWVGTAERVLALALVGWAAALGTQLTHKRPGQTWSLGVSEGGLEPPRPNTGTSTSS